jgi:fatty-acid peroxygenase
MRALVQDVRQGRVSAPRGSVLDTIAATDLDARTAAVELGNVIRPTIAVSWLGAFAGLALSSVDDQPWWRQQLLDGDPRRARWAVAQEVRRTAPFVPALAGRVRRATRHEGVDLGVGDRVVLDVRGIDLDPDVYADPRQFRPERFLDREPTPYDLVPQGGGLPRGHRCPGSRWRSSCST